jgi:hypothetical protein
MRSCNVKHVPLIVLTERQTYLKRDRQKDRRTDIERERIDREIEIERRDIEIERERRDRERKSFSVR